jgi:hypothetical protein
MTAREDELERRLLELGRLLAEVEEPAGSNHLDEPLALELQRPVSDARLDQIVDGVLASQNASATAEPAPAAVPRRPRSVRAYWLAAAAAVALAVGGIALWPEPDGAGGSTARVDDAALSPARGISDPPRSHIPEGSPTARAPTIRAIRPEEDLLGPRSRAPSAAPATPPPAARAEPTQPPAPASSSRPREARPHDRYAPKSLPRAAPPTDPAPAPASPPVRDAWDLSDIEFTRSSPPRAGAPGEGPPDASAPPAASPAPP